MTLTYGDAFARHDIDIPPHLDADTTIPVLTGIQRQGDIIIIPAAVGLDDGDPVGAAGVQLVAGEHTGNTHWLDPENPDVPVLFARGAGGVDLGTLVVPADTTALITHTDEHGSVRCGPGRYELRRQREADRVVAD